MLSSWEKSGGDMTHSHDTLAVSPEYDPATGTYQVDYNSTEYTPSTAVVLAVAAVTETDPLDVAPLNDCVDPGCLDGLFASKQDGTPRAVGQVTFPFADHDVTVHSDGTVVLVPQPG